MEERSKKWTRPELVVFARSRAEETAVSFCKVASGAGAGFQSDNNGCYIICAQCSGFNAS